MSIVLVSERVCQAAPGATTHRWVEPCKLPGVPSKPNTLNTSSFTKLINNIKVAQDLKRKAGDVFKLAEEIKLAYGKDRIQSTGLKLKTEENAPYGFPSTNVLDKLSLLQRMREDYQRASLAAVFLDKMRREETTSVYTAVFTALETELYSFLCHLRVAISNRTSKQIKHVNRSVIKLIERQLSNGSIAEREIRDYRILVYITRLFGAIESDFSTSTRIMVIDNRTS